MDTLLSFMLNLSLKYPWQVSVTTVYIGIGLILTRRMLLMNNAKNDPENGRLTQWKPISKLMFIGVFFFPSLWIYMIIELIRKIFYYTVDEAYGRTFLIIVQFHNNQMNNNNYPYRNIMIDYGKWVYVPEYVVKEMDDRRKMDKKVEEND